MGTDSYSEEGLEIILSESISEFRKILKKEDNGSGTLPDPHNFRYLHEFKNHDHTKGGILVVGLNPHIGEKENNHEWRVKYHIDERNTSDYLLTKYSYFKKFTAQHEDDNENIGCPNIRQTTISIISLFDLCLI